VLTQINFRSADLYTANCWKANLDNADLRDADLSSATLNGVSLRNADLRGANLRFARMVAADVSGAKFSGCHVYGCSIWNLKGQPREQSDLVVTPPSESQVLVDDLQVAQFVYLLLNNKSIRDVIDTIGSKSVLILGRFTPERKSVLDSLRSGLRAAGFVPMMFDFERPTQRDFTETIKTLAGLSLFIVADITNPRSSPLELQAVMPDYMIPFVPIIADDEEPFPMFRDLKQKYGQWVLDLLKYDSIETLMKVLLPAVIQPAIQKSQELVSKKAEAIRIRHATDYLPK
jgi:Pentapeptide repeats (8 copies)